MGRIAKYLILHLAVMFFSFTGVFSKLASVRFNEHGLMDLMLYVYLFCMFLVCFVYALAWQKIIKRFDLNVAYANKNVYLIWSQVWAVLLFHETISLQNMIGILLVFVGVLVVIFNE